MILTEWAQRLTDPTPGEDEYLLQKCPFKKPGEAISKTLVSFFSVFFKMQILQCVICHFFAWSQ